MTRAAFLVDLHPICRALLAALALAAAPAQAAPAPATFRHAPAAAERPFATPFTFGDAALGMSLEAWRALPPPAGGQADCRPSPPGSAPAGRTCRYRSSLSGGGLAMARPLLGRFRAQDLRYRFVQRRLAEIRFRTSIDAFSAVVARLKRTYGAAPTIVRDQARIGGRRLERVRMSWRMPRGEVELVDPSGDPATLEVRLQGPPSAA